MLQTGSYRNVCPMPPITSAGRDEDANHTGALSARYRRKTEAQHEGSAVFRIR